MERGNVEFVVGDSNRLLVVLNFFLVLLMVNKCCSSNANQAKTFKIALNQANS